jgi:excinuclease ABC subunit C
MASQQHHLFRLVQQLPQSPGVYLFKNSSGDVIYVGKANVLRSRVGQYFQPDRINKKTQHLMRDACSIEFFITNNSQEALILENELIKSYRPQYNIALKDGKSYPYIVLTDDDFPRMGLYRGRKNKHHTYFGPYPHAKAAREMVELLQKLFLIRDCSNSAFKFRTRPCMQYQIKKCSAPCVGKVNQQEYAQQVGHVKDFLMGRSKALMLELNDRMQKASDALEFEKAAQFRDALGQIRLLLERQVVEGEGSWDIWLLGQDFQQYIVLLIKVRDGKVMEVRHEDFGNEQVNTEEISSWIYHYYKINQPDGAIGVWIDQEILMGSEIIDVISKQWPGNYWQVSQSDKINEWLAMGRRQISNMLPFKALARQDWGFAIDYLKKLLKIDDSLSVHVECFDVSHFGGQGTSASCVVMDDSGLRKDLYRNFHILKVDNADDYAATMEVLQRRVLKIDNQSVIWLIDGGKGQIRVAKEVIASYPCVKGVIGIAKGPTRRFEHERYFILNLENQIVEINLPMTIRQVIGLLRDQAHDRALQSSQMRQKRKLLKGTLDDIKGVGPVIKKRLKAHFGSVNNIRQATVRELMQVPGVGEELAHQIANHLSDC